MATSGHFFYNVLLVQLPEHSHIDTACVDLIMQSSNHRIVAAELADRHVRYPEQPLVVSKYKDVVKECGEVHRTHALDDGVVVAQCREASLLILTICASKLEI